MNWDEAVGVGVSVMKGHHRGGASQPEATNPYFAAVVQKFLSGNPEYVRRFLNLWETVPIHIPRLRWDYPVRWQHPQAGLLHFQVNVTVLNTDQGVSLNEWVPVNANTWSALETLRDG